MTGIAYINGVTRVLTIDLDAGFDVEEAAALIRSGQLVAFPTETVYGLGANALDTAAVQRIFDAKGRPATNPLIVHVHDIAAARSLASSWPDTAQRLAEAFWPGPLTLVLPRAGHVPDITTAGLDTVAIRIPAHPVAQALIKAAGVPIAAPSANRSMELSPTRAEHVVRSLGDRVALVLDGGSTDVGIESTVVDLTENPPRVIRPGTLSLDDLARIIPSIIFRSEDRPKTLKAPGMMERHYAPRARVAIFDSLPELDALLAGSAAALTRIAVVSFHETGRSVDAEIRLPAHARNAAAILYATLHALDEQKIELVIIEQPPDTADWAGVRDRLKRMTAG